MLKAPTEFIIVFILVSVILMLILVVFIGLIIYRYQQRQNVYFKDIEALKISHENELLQSQLEIQEQTFQNISREIHDNIGQKLTLAKFHLNTLNYLDTEKTKAQVQDSAIMIGESIKDLSDISHSMSSEVILNNGLIRALEYEAIQLEKSGVYRVNLQVTGETVFLDANSDLVIFRIAQECINNIVKHSFATMIEIAMHYNPGSLIMKIRDNGKGFEIDNGNAGIGLQNIKKRAKILNGTLDIISSPNNGTEIIIEIPFNENNRKI